MKESRGSVKIPIKALLLNSKNDWSKKRTGVPQRLQSEVSKTPEQIKRQKLMNLC